ncbi:MAG: beta strand repeat-containing protein [Sphingorhabdus sp.]
MDANNNITPISPAEAIDGASASAVAAAASANMQLALQVAALVPGQDGQLVLPQGVSLNDIRVVGRDLVVRMPDGSEVVVPDGAIVVPQFVVDGVAVPPVNLAALLIGQEPQPAAGPAPSSGGNFAQDPGDIGDPFDLGDLLPPTQLAFPEPQQEELLPGLIDRDPDVNIQDGGPAGKDVTDNVSEVGLPGTRVNGNVESPGSSTGNGSDSTTGFIIVTSPDGIASITINGTTYTGVAGQQITTARGVLTLGALSGDQIPYTYRLTDNTSGDNTTDVFTVVLTDPDGDSSTARLTIVIADDVPTARNDTDSVAGGTYGPESGNVLSGSGTTSGSAGADTLGADGAAVSGFRAGSSGNFAAVGTTIAGQYGTLTLGANGSYTYVRNTNTPGGVSDVFTYQITDGDGDASTATLTINIGDAPNRITFIPEIGEGTEVREPHLPARDGEPAGSQFDGNSETTTGTIIFNSPDGVGSVTVSGVTITPGSLPQTIVSNATGTLVVTGYSYNPTTGVGSITYVYTLNDNTLNTSGSTVSFPVVVTDLDGDAASDQLDIRIIDDAPLAANDSDSIAAGQYGPATGNVITDAEGDGGADIKGADGATVTAVSGTAAGTVGGSTAGQYGVLTLNADGSYSYVRNAGTPGGVSDVFSYTITDGDGDPSTATLTISIADSPTTLDLPTEGEAGTQVDEAGLATGSAAATDSEFTAGTIAYTAPDGPATVTIDGVAVTAVGQTFSGAYGTLTITSIATGAIGYKYELTTNTSGDATFDDFAVVVTDQDGDNTPGTLVIDIVDDVPTARADVDSVKEDGPTVADGNVITGANVADANTTDGVVDTKGADGATVTAVAFGATNGTVGSALAGTYGSLTLNADGSYSYTLNNDDPRIQGLDSDDSLTEVFTYTITDGDGDPSTTTLTITINGSDDIITINGLNAEGPDLIVDEDDLADGSSPDAAALTQSGSFTVNGLDGIASIKIQGTEAFVGQTFTTAYGKFTITSISAPADGNATAITVGYSYLLTDNTAHANANGQNFLTELFDVEVTDTDGSTDTDQVEVRIIDDVPTAANDTDSVASGTYGPVSGNVITDASAGDAGDTDTGADTPGADGVTVSNISGFGGAGTVGGATAGQYGVLTLNPDGSYTYVRNAGTPGGVSDVFSYTVTDSDGDTATATLTIAIEDARPVTAENGVVQLDDDALAGGNPGGTGDDPDAVNVTGTLAGSGGDGPLTWTAISYIPAVGMTAALVNPGLIEVFQGATLVMTITINNSTGAYTVTQNAPIDHAALGDENNATFQLNYRVTDQDGDFAGGSIVINLDDDTPVVSNDTDLILSGSEAPATGNVLTDASAGDAGDTDTGADSLGADGGAVTAITGFGGAGTIGGTTNGQYGVLTLNADGSYSYVRNSGTPGNVQDVFTYTVTDGDGDTATATLTIDIEDARPIVGTNLTVLLDDDAVAGAGGNPGGTGDDADAANLTGILSGSGGDGALTWAAISYVPTVGMSAVLVNPGLIQVFQGATLVITVTINNSTGAYTVTQNAPIDHTALGDENNATFQLNYRVTDTDGDFADGSLLINIDDDTPTVTVSGVAPVLSVDETNFTVNDSDDFSGLFSQSFGADGPAAANSVSYTLGVVAGPSGLTDTLTGEAVNLVLNGTTVEGRTATGNLLVFTLTVNASGTVTLDQSRAVIHDPNLGANDVETIAANLITLTKTVTDGDGDSASATANIGDRLNFVDDAPTALTATTSGTVDEDGLTGGIAGGTGDVAGEAVSATGSVTGLFSAGADSPLTYSLSTNTAGLPALTSGGVALSYTVVGNLLTASAGATPVFTLSLNATTGAWTFTLLAKLDHPAGNNENDITLQFGGLIIATDKDGDPVTATGNLTVTVDDDTPVAANDTDAVTEDGPTVANGNVLTGVGSDGIAAGADSLGADGPAVGGAVTAIAGGTLGVARAGSYGSLTLNADGSYSYTLTNSNPLVQGLDTGETLTDVFTYTITDRDGDSTTATLTITINGTNDAPVVTPSTVSVSEEGLGGANADGTGTPDTTNLAANGGTIVATDVDGEALTFTLGNPGAVLTSGGLPVTWIGVGTGTLTGRVETSPGVFANVITVTINNSGVYTVTLIDQVDHAGINVEDLKTFTVPVSVSDGTATTNTNLTVNIEDDSPIALTATTSGTVDEDGLANGIGGGVDDVPGTDTVATGSVTGLFSAGADSPLKYALATNTSGLPALKSNGADVTYQVVSTPTGSLLTASAGGQTVFTLALNESTGVWTFNLLRQLDHAAGNNENDIVINFGSLVTATDADNDNVSATGNLTITIDDDTPIAQANTASVVEGAVVTGTVLGNDSFGADGPTTTTPAGGVVGVRALAGDFTTPVTTGTGTQITGLYGKLTLNADGSYSYDGDPNVISTAQADVFVYTIRDADGDLSTTTLTINLTPVTLVADNETATVNEAGLDLVNDAGPDTVAGTVNGSNPTSDSDVATGTLSVAGATSYTLSGSGTGSYGTLVLNSNGTYSYTLTRPFDTTPDNNNGVTTETGKDVFTYTATDANGNSITGTITVDIIDDVPTATATAVPGSIAALDETATSSTASTLGTTNIGDDPDVAGSGRIAVATTSGAVVTAGGVYGADGANAVNPLIYGLVVTNAVSGLFVTDGAAINLVKEGDLVVGRVASGTFAGKAAFAIAINPTTGVVTVEQYLSLDHPLNPNPDDLISLAAGSLGVTVTRTDGDGDKATSVAADISGQITFDDDGPTLGVIQNQQASNDPAQTPAIGTLHFTDGADGSGSTMTITANTTGLTSGGLPVLTSQTGNVLTGYVNTNGTAGYQAGADTAVFTLTVNPDAGTSGQYVFDLITALDPTVTDVPIGSGSSFGVGPSASVIVTDDATAQQLVFVTGWSPTGGFTPAEQTAWLGGASPTVTQTTNVNGSTQGWGLANNNFDAGEFLRFDFGALNDYDGAGGYSPPAGTGPMANVSYATFSFFQFNAGETVKFVAHYVDGTTQSFVIDGATDSGTFTINSPAGTQIAWIDVYQSDGDMKLNLTNVGVTSSNIDKTIPFTLQLTDGDGDTTTTNAFSVRVSSGLTPFAPAAPVVLDLDGDGAEFLSSAAGVAFDYAGDGNPESTAWVGADDGLLALDSNANGLVDNGSEIVFGGNGLTDLQGLAATYDSNKDGVLDANDADFAKFGVWQDANSNGVTDAGEFQSLSDAGITSINLVSDGVEYAAADGDVTVHGTSSYTKADGTTGDVADASFATSGGSKAAANENDLRVLASANSGMASSMVAASLVAAVAAAPEIESELLGKIGGGDFATREIVENGVTDMQFEARDNAPLFDRIAGSDSFDRPDAAEVAKFSSYEQAEDHGFGDFGGFGGQDSGSLISELLGQTEIEHAAYTQPDFVIGAHVDAASEALIAIQQGDMFAKAAIEEVVSDALAGGFSEGPNVDALLNALAGPADGQQLLGETLAQQFGDLPVFEAINYGAANDMLDQLASTHMELSAATGHHG